jgi:hypothetical protein
MAVKQFYHDIDLVKVGQLTNARLQNVADAAALAAITTPGVGQIVYQVDTDELKIYDGAVWDTIAPTIEGDVVFRGTIDASLALNNVGQPQTVTAASGNQYVVTTAGTLTLTGVTFSPSAAAEVGDIVLFTSASQAYVIQRNIEAASETVAGFVELATTAEVTAGTDTTRAVTPAGLASAMQTNQYTRQYSGVLTTVNADEATTVTHGLALINRDAFVVNVMLGNSAISVDVDSVDADSLTITSSVALSNVRVTVVGASSTEFAIA